MQTEVFCGEYVHLPFLRVKLSFQGRETLKKKSPYPPRKTSVCHIKSSGWWISYTVFQKKSKKLKKFFRRISGGNRRMCGLSAATPCGPPELQLKCLKEVCSKKAVCFWGNDFYTRRLVCSERKKSKITCEKGL